MTYKQLILSDLLNGEVMTVWKAIQRYGNTNCRQEIHHLRKEGYDISCTMIEGENGKRYGEYRLLSKPSGAVV